MRAIAFDGGVLVSSTTDAVSIDTGPRMPAVCRRVAGKRMQPLMSSRKRRRLDAEATVWPMSASVARCTRIRVQPYLGLTGDESPAGPARHFKSGHCVRPAGSIHKHSP